MLTLEKTKLAIIGVLIISIIVAVALVQRGTAQSKPLPPFGSLADAPEHGPTFQFIDAATRRFRAPLWDDRELTDEQRKANPSFNPGLEALQRVPRTTRIRGSRESSTAFQPVGSRSGPPDREQRQFET